MIITYATSINIILMFHYFIFITIRSITKIENAPNSEENVTIRYSNKTVGMTEAISGDVTVLPRRLGRRYICLRAIDW